MKIYTSYFYMIRFFTPNMIPISTAKYDPKWFTRDGKPYVDKNGVLNGLNFREFNPGSQLDGLCLSRNSCDKDPSECEFLKQYRIQLDGIMQEQIINRIDILKCKYEETFKIPYDDIKIVFIVHEDPTNLCSERKVIQDWWNRFDQDKCKEWSHQFNSE